MSEDHDPSDVTATPGPGRRPGPEEGGKWLTTGVGSVSVTSFLSDSGHEIATAVLPSFVTSVLHGSAASLGLIEGVSDALTGVMKLVGGPLANDPRRRRRMVTGGYLGTAIATAAIGLATAVWQVGVLRALAWSSRGLRSPAKDTLLASLVPRHAFGRAYGLERAGDNLGAVVGPLAAAGLVAWLVSGRRSGCHSSPASWPRSRSPSRPVRHVAATRTATGSRSGCGSPGCGTRGY